LSELDHESCSSLSKFEALARRDKIHEVSSHDISAVGRYCNYFGLWLSLVERLVRDNCWIVFSNYPHLL
jgi:hypothetical protein